MPKRLIRMGKLSARALARLRNARGFVFDMDGTLVLGDKSNHGLKPLPGALEITACLSQHKIPFVLFTNGTASTPQHYMEALRAVGFCLEGDAVMTPAVSAADYFQRHGYRRILVLGGEGLTKPLTDLGMDIIPAAGSPHADAVLIGWFREFTMPALEAATHAVWNGAEAFSCSQSLFFATANGKALGTSRAISAMIRDLTGCRIHVIGKPSLDALRCAARRLGVRTAELAVVGDDPSLEIPMAHRGGSLAIAVSTGIGGADSFSHLPKSQQPHILVHDVAELLALYKGQA
ncbi:MAG TPA: HAD hydrolase-like protein [Candidatus Acidoferrales bacterium]|nr:HAD hydrolase-like protein [Candidatus Acidoferrales bacterium]